MRKFSFPERILIILSTLLFISAHRSSKKKIIVWGRCLLGTVGDDGRGNPDFNEYPITCTAPIPLTEPAECDLTGGGGTLPSNFNLIDRTSTFVTTLTNGSFDGDGTGC